MTTTALALAAVWQRQVIVAECDPLGGEVLAGYGQGSVAGGRGVLEMVLAARGGAGIEQRVWEHLVALDQSRRRWLLPGVGHPQEAAAVPWDRVATMLAGLDNVDVVADCGRLRTQGAPGAVWRAADLTVLLLGAATPQVYAVWRSEQVLRDTLGITGQVGDGVVAVVVGPGGPHHGTTEIRRHLDPLGIPVIGSLAHDPAAAAVLSRGAPPPRRGFGSSTLLRSATELADVLTRRATEHHTRVTPPPVPQLSSEPEGARW